MSKNISTTETVKKAIIIEDCLDCPLGKIGTSLRVFCNSAAVEMKKPKLVDRLVSETIDKTPIPSWCPLSNYSDRVVAYFIDNKIEIPEKLRTLALKDEGRA